LPGTSKKQKIPSAKDTQKAVRSWAWLIEQNRVWNPKFLDAPQASAEQ
jgi:hypothetical protein